MELQETKEDGRIVLSYSTNDASFTGMNTVFIPKEADFIPSKLNQVLAIKSLANSFKNKEVQSITSDTIEFVDCGENFESVKCNHCTLEIDLSFWQSAMSNAYNTNFKDLTITTPCCGVASDLNSLEYYFAQGFARYQLTIQDASLSEKQILDLTAELSQIIGSQLKVIISKY